MSATVGPPGTGGVRLEPVARCTQDRGRPRKALASDRRTNIRVKLVPCT